jgi:hypothetical protein
MARKKKQNKGKSSRKKPETLREIYARIKREFSAADLQKYTVIEEGVPAEQVLADMRKIHETITARRKKA